MNTQSIALWNCPEIRQRHRSGNAGGAIRTLRTMFRALAAATTGLAVILAAAWFAGDPGLVLYLQVTVWTSGFLFLGLALESRWPAAVLHVATAAALPALAWLSEHVAVEFSLVAAALIATWIAAGIYRRL